jgi:hypothetical protein
LGSHDLGLLGGREDPFSFDTNVSNRPKVEARIKTSVPVAT